MNLVDLSLSFAALLLWIGWRAAGASRPALGRMPFSPLLRSTTASVTSRHFLLLGLLVLLLARSWIYWRLGAEVNWIAEVNLGIVTLPFKSLVLGRMVLYSYLSFLVLLGGYYLWLLLLSMANRAVPDTVPLQRAVRQQLGWLEPWPLLLKLVGPWILVALLWYISSPLLVRLGLTVAPRASIHLWQQGALIGLGTTVAWKYLIGVVLLLHVVNSYLYLGNRPLWSFVNATARNLLRPIRWLPLRFGRVDFTPVVGIAANFLLFAAAEALLRHFFDRLPQ
jgi:uncharacterized protein YggT (Ycf19 family)